MANHYPVSKQEVKTEKMFIARMGRKITNHLSSAVANPDVGWWDNLIVNKSNRICVASFMSWISAALPSANGLYVSGETAHLPLP